MQYENIHAGKFTPDSTVQSVIRHLDLTTRKLLTGNKNKVILTAVQVHSPGSGAYEGPGWNASVAGPIDIACSADGGMTYLLNELSSDLVVLPSATPAVKPADASSLPEITVGHRPIGLAVSPVTATAYVYNLLARDVSVVDLATLKEVRRIPATPVTGEPFSTAELRDAKIFYSSDDPRISRNAKIACASCHLNGEADGRDWDFHHLPGQHGLRDTHSLLGLRSSLKPRDTPAGWGQLHRSGDRDEIQDFEHTFQNAQMGGTGFLGAQAHPDLGEPNAGRSPDLDALARYLLSIEPIARSPYRAPEGTLTEPEAGCRQGLRSSAVNSLMLRCKRMLMHLTWSRR